MSDESELVDKISVNMTGRIARLVAKRFSRKAERERRRIEGITVQCRGCGKSITHRGHGRPREWCGACLRPGGVKDRQRRAYQREYYQKRKAEAQGEGGQ